MTRASAPTSNARGWPRGRAPPADPASAPCACPDDRAADALTALQLYSELRGAGDRIGLTTVHRALHTLTDAGLVHEFRGTSDEASYRPCSPTPTTT